MTKLLDQSKDLHYHMNQLHNISNRVSTSLRLLDAAIYWEDMERYNPAPEVALDHYRTIVHAVVDDAARLTAMLNEALWDFEPCALAEARRRVLVSGGVVGATAASEAEPLAADNRTTTESTKGAQSLSDALSVAERLLKAGDESDAIVAMNRVVAALRPDSPVTDSRVQSLLRSAVPQARRGARVSGKGK